MTDDHKTHDALVADCQENAKKHDDDNYWFLRSLKQKSFKKVDRIALELHQEAFSIVDCTKETMGVWHGYRKGRMDAREPTVCPKFGTQRKGDVMAKKKSASELVDALIADVGIAGILRILVDKFDLAVVVKCLGSVVEETDATEMEEEDEQ